ncbi:MAG: hypothetical protein LBK99_01455 [Opitutaceae bacterium]|jgi:hypothetical protein|nr:hypothetical protein [Opitutaceae bacterium]
MQNLTLEVSLKPFCNLDDAATLVTCAEAFRQWDHLARHASAISILFWASDGSEILDYTGDLDAEMEWARYVGNSNPHLDSIPADPEKKSLHSRAWLYRPDARPITYRRLSAIARAWREAAAAAPATKGKPFRVGLAFDPGGEFAPSDFKYKRHREICLSDTMGKASFVCCYGILNSDTRRYAAFPEGIPQGTSIGAFLGRQFRLLAADIGLDYLWLSNGFGFGMETWLTIGPLFDGTIFTAAIDPQKARDTRDRILAFWRDLRNELPAHIGIETRGTNLGTATDLASDATPLRELYEGKFNFAPPPNSPWAAINGDFGIELAGYMSRIAELPPERAGFPFRYYIHDPWWLNSPWLDRYEGQPHDIYLPLATARVAADCRIQTADTLNLLGIDDSHGRMPEIVPDQSTPHLLRAWAERPDAPGPFVWLYPFDEIHDAMFGSQPAPGRLFHIDWFVREAINDGLPLNTVISTRTFTALAERRTLDVLAGRVLVAPAPLDPASEQRLLDRADAGGSLLVYGPLDTAPVLRSRLGLAPAAPLAGRLDIRSSLPVLDCFLTDSERTSHYEHRSIASAGALTETSAPDAATPPVVAVRDGESRALAAHFQTPSGGLVWWLRAPLPLSITKGTHLPVPDRREDAFPFSELVRQTIARFGWHISRSALSPARRRPVLGIHRHANAWLFSGYMPDTTVELVLRTPFGVPLLIGCETLLTERGGAFRLPRAWRHECRVFIDGQTTGVAGCIERHPAQVGVTRRLLVSGLRDATLRFFPPPDAGPITAFVNLPWPFISGDTAPLKTIQTPHGPMLATSATVSGDILLSW